MKHVVIPGDGEGDATNDGSEMIQQLSEVSVDNRVSNCRILVLIKSWSLRKIQQEFGVTNYMAQKSRARKGKGYSFSSQPKIRSFTSTRNS